VQFRFASLKALQVSGSQKSKRALHRNHHQSCRNVYIPHSNLTKTFLTPPIPSPVSHLSASSLSHPRSLTLQAPLEDIDRAFLSQFIALMRRDGVKVLKHGRNAVNRRTIRISNKATHVTWNSMRSTWSTNSAPAAIALNDVVEVSRGAFPGSVAMPMGKVKRCVALVAPGRRLLMECEYEEDADLLFAGLSILSLGKASRKMADQRQKTKDSKLEAELTKLCVVVSPFLLLRLVLFVLVIVVVAMAVVVA